VLRPVADRFEKLFAKRAAARRRRALARAWSLWDAGARSGVVGDVGVECWQEIRCFSPPL